MVIYVRKMVIYRPEKWSFDQPAGGIVVGPPAAGQTGTGQVRDQNRTETWDCLKHNRVHERNRDRNRSRTGVVTGTGSCLGSDRDPDMDEELIVCVGDVLPSSQKP